jgi:hypothetical protein
MNNHNQDSIGIEQKILRGVLLLLLILGLVKIVASEVRSVYNSVREATVEENEGGRH